MKLPFRLALAAPLALLLLGGCGRSGDVLAPAEAPSTPSADQEAVSQEVNRHPELVDEEVYASSEQTPVEDQATQNYTAGSSEIRPLFFWRDIRRVEKSFEFAFADTDSTGLPTTAIVTVHKFLHGSFNILVRDTTGDHLDDSRVIRKPLHDHWVRRILLKRTRVADSDRALWKIVACSGVKITSRDAQTRIVSVRFQGGDVDTTFTDPLAFQRLRRIPRFQPETEVQVTVTTLTNTDVVLLYAHDRRRRMTNNGDNTYGGVLRIGRHGLIRHVGLNALSHGTLFDENAAYDSQAWILPYVVYPTDLGEVAS